MGDLRVADPPPAPDKVELLNTWLAQQQQTNQPQPPAPQRQHEWEICVRGALRPRAAPRRGGSATLKKLIDVQM